MHFYICVYPRHGGSQDAARRGERRPFHVGARASLAPQTFASAVALGRDSFVTEHWLAASKVHLSIRATRHDATLTFAHKSSRRGDRRVATIILYYLAYDVTRGDGRITILFPQSQSLEQTREFSIDLCLCLCLGWRLD